ncbi:MULTISPECIES: HlyD family secretion protein [unclassified Sphingobium]|uniref:HlyD family secretion protein n=1 Tax=unclassified Sphingobium TaxID=2611147 RepID=UPI0011997D04|nr:MULTISPECIES: HlyD family secretion protein [unclassified Sphingobium]MBG6117370.1 multidrug resistance efflux pump [Sphingobium sp. JAI105]TWC97205.1 multidrug resistance efflux pump [Sphingobium sp. AEW010]TWD17385.1 multidrug resistance efflux pump [Sphingobium sp. AEW013]TWD19907.1 multidrug resistance efflux pump [Sphingobium sp. AEW001]
MTDAVQTRDAASPATVPDEDPATDAGVSDTPPPPKTIKTSGRTMAIMAVLFLCGLLIIQYAWRIWPFTSPVVTTENAYVRGQITAMAPQVAGYVVEADVRDFAHVRRGQVLLRIDDRIYRQQLDSALAALQVAQAELANWSQTVAQNQATLRTRQADLAQASAKRARAQADIGRVSELASRGSVSLRERDQVLATERTSAASIERAQAAIEGQQQTIIATRVSRGSLEGRVAQAQAQVDLARINLGNTVIRAPRDGQISEASVRVGQYVQAGSQLMFLVPDQIWVVANYKETQTARMRLGQPASFTVDALDGARLTGRIEQFAPATGSEFSVLRPDNASGNFTKIVQRITVRIRIDSNQPLVQRLRPGMSVVARVDTTGASSLKESVR